ncbi:hypothetical protein GCM10011374_35430 [Kocuria dechangensis]|uniref:Uncharacterized protein n=1 Tax=Kocuria dechangensis TaxID=1176249 RepID=A0A917H579_9MICC|nr:hypothetical protein GCM10011374_35430 [Kocuria dechangensis]
MHRASLRSHAGGLRPCIDADDVELLHALARVEPVQVLGLHASPVPHRGDPTQMVLELRASPRPRAGEHAGRRTDGHPPGALACREAAPRPQQRQHALRAEREQATGPPNPRGTRGLVLAAARRNRRSEETGTKLSVCAHNRFLPGTNYLDPHTRFPEIAAHNDCVVIRSTDSADLRSGALRAHGAAAPTGFISAATRPRMGESARKCLRRGRVGRIRPYWIGKS